MAAGLIVCSALSLAAGHPPAAPAGASAAKAAAARTPAGAHAPANARAPAKAQAPARLVDVNSASRKQLKTLPGIGDAEADRIIAGRPYLTKAHLVTNNAIPAGLYFSLKRSIVALPPKAGKPQ